MLAAAPRLARLRAVAGARTPQPWMPSSAWRRPAAAALSSASASTTRAAPGAPPSSRDRNRQAPRLDESELALEEQILGTAHEFLGDEGEVVDVSRGVVSVVGLADARPNDVVQLGDQGLRGFVLRLENRVTKIAALGSSSAAQVRSGAFARLLPGDEGKLRAAALDAGQVSTPIGVDYWTQEPLPLTLKMTMDSKQGAPTLPERSIVREQLWTGILTLDALYPLGRGTRTALMGKNPAGMRYVAMNLLSRQSKLAESDREVDFAIWLSAGLDQSGIRKTYLDLEAMGALAFTAIVAAPASDPWALRALGPAALCAMAEDRAARGENVLVIIDSLGPVGAALAEVEGARSGARVTPLFQPHRYLERLGALQSGGSVTTLALLHQDDSTESEQVRDRIAGQVDTTIDMQGLRSIRAVGARLPGIRAYQAPALRELAWRLQVRLKEASSAESAGTIARRLGIDPMDEENLGTGLAHAQSLRALFEADVNDETLTSRAQELLALYVAAEGFLEAPSLTTSSQIKPAIAAICEAARENGLLDQLENEVLKPSKTLVSDCPAICQALDIVIFDTLCKF
ncbi:ATP synthase subunit alpha, chloroplastic [Hondaea fermentalgiana]|uniref:ATP synthase subunit alpha, chloroplastic n=1 Tax=Hondaea fermentalgiana TaxID=2315210 RepID=A0A2R5GRM6_9STRA|nr:ATP synthase subunit alpha, chloroplastic [Hondaea fermentalgiana]|eukprot:GBG33500.1 ATP synthase subunit alpha, chloroplastic [Hondaea fermentalgiana]